jgi:hypothetical protein
MVGWVVSKINLFTKIGTRIGSIGVVSNYVCRTSTKSANLASGHGIDNKNRHYQNYFKWIMFLAKIHRWRIIIAINFGSNFLWKLYRILKYPLKLKTFNLQGPCTRYNNLLVSKKSFLVGVQTWPHKGFMFVITTNHSIEWILVLVCIFGSPFSMLILTSYCSTTCKVARPSQSIMWNYPPRLVEVHPRVKIHWIE